MFFGPTISSVGITQLNAERLSEWLVVTSLLANLVIEGTVERKHLGHYYSEQMVGVMIIRGENVVLLGEIVRAFLFYYQILITCVGFRC